MIEEHRSCYASKSHIITLITSIYISLSSIQHFPLCPCSLSNTVFSVIKLLTHSLVPAMSLLHLLSSEQSERLDVISLLSLPWVYFSQGDSRSVVLPSSASVAVWTPTALEYWLSLLTTGHRCSTFADPQDWSC